MVHKNTWMKASPTHIISLYEMKEYKPWFHEEYLQPLVQRKQAKYNWVKRDQLDVTCLIISLLNAQHVLDVNTSILRSLRLNVWSYFVGYIDLVRCVLELLCGMVVVVWYPNAGWGTSASACIRIPYHKVTPTRIEPD